MKAVAYAGEPGAFAEDAVLVAFGDVERLAVGSFRDVFDAVDAARAGAGMLPVENLLNGTVRETYDLLLEHDLAVVGETVVPVRLCLAALPGQTLDDIGRVYSHIQALGQAEAFLRTRPWTTLTTYNTAGAGKLIRAAGERRAAAILSPRAAALFDLEVLADDIQGAVDNRTRFLVVARPAQAQEVAAAIRAPASGALRRTTLVFAVRNEPGTLLAALRAFAERGVNLSKLESRPSRTAAWEYVFWADLDADADEPACAAAIGALRSVSTMVRVFGSYPRAGDRPIS
ncbi:MAG: ACT domain-containing protein [Chloroflexi bacterium]|nr:ACT domain-containing protein [Chloroflexota bacterium]